MMKSRTLLFAVLACVLAVSAAAQSSQTLSGTVVSSSSTQLVIDTATGQRTFDVDASSNLPAGLAVGSRVDVDYHELAGGRMHAATVRMSSAAPTTPTAETTSPTTPTTTDMPRTTAPATGTGMAATDDDDDDAPQRATGSLPRTASPLPLLGLAGLAALAGGLALRRR